jgi:hypothetical protein
MFWLELRRFFELAWDAADKPETLSRLHPALSSFVFSQRAQDHLHRLKRSCAQKQRFMQGLHEWFDSLKIIRALNFWRKETGSRPLVAALQDFYGMRDWPMPANPDTLEAWLADLRCRQSAAPRVAGLAPFEGGITLAAPDEDGS